ncbi:hypothetical protein ACFLY2_03190 [Patescibacteria group bacterium]
MKDNQYGIVNVSPIKVSPLDKVISGIQSVVIFIEPVFLLVSKALVSILYTSSVYEYIPVYPVKFSNHQIE